MKRIRDGREDYEYLHFLATHGKRSQAMHVARGLFPTLYRTDVTQAELDDARGRLVDLIDPVRAART
jgi:hypothetical protein